MEKIRVAFLVNQLSYGGTEKAVQILAQHLDRTIFEPAVCGVYSGGYREEPLRKEGIEVGIADGSFTKLKRFLEDFHVDITHIHRAGGREPMPIEASYEAGAKVILETNHFGDVDFSESGRKLDFHIMISKFVANRFMRRRGLSVDDFLKSGTVIYNPVDIESIERFRPSTSKIDKVREGLEIGDHHLLGRVGRVEAKWNYFPIDVASHVVRKGFRVKYLIVGGLPEDVKRKIVSRNLEKVFVDVGKVSDEELSSFYHIFDVLAHTSKRGETFGYTLAEAMAAEKPVVVQSTPYADNAQVELVDNGRTGLVANTPSTYGQALIELLKHQDLKFRLGKAGKLKATEMFDSHEIARAHKVVYLHLLKMKDTSRELPSMREAMGDWVRKQREELDEYPRSYAGKLSDLFEHPGVLDRILTDIKYGSTYLSLENYYRRRVRKRLKRILQGY